MLEQVRTVPRPGPAEALRAQQQGALLVDTRPEPFRVAEGEIPGSVIIERNDLEWRLDPASSAALPIAGTAPVIVFCNEGYASSLAAASLRALGVDATDLDGGFRGWLADGLPVRTGRGSPA